MVNNNTNNMARAKELLTAEHRDAHILAPIDRRPKLAEDHIDPFDQFKEEPFQRPPQQFDPYHREYINENFDNIRDNYHHDLLDDLRFEMSQKDDQIRRLNVKIDKKADSMIGVQGLLVRFILDQKERDIR
uniref:Uncharacterized protein n=1 Tax=Romanomermis culicivorax TaxID=13658 RepID=A0A915I440_ROMCU